ncbi:MAG TPA: ATP-binding protein [Gemmatimonadaceae bacterium]|nr:ATP-binding protein [Gemmatimonadaceae bacterium]
MRFISRRWHTWMLWLLLLAAVTLAMLAARSHLEKAHIALLFLLVVLGGSAAGGRALGVTLALAAFLGFNFLFLPPYHTFVIANPLDWLVLLAFLVTGIVAAQLLDRAQSEAAGARRRAAEVDRLATLGAETLSAGRAEEALAAVARVIRTTLGVAECDVYVRDAMAGTPAHAIRERAAGPIPAPVGVTGIVAWVAEHGHAAAELPDGTVRMAAEPGAHAVGPLLEQTGDVRALMMPLTVRDRTVGVLQLTSPEGITLDSAQRRFLDALAFYAALGVERVRLSAEAERAEALREADRLKDALLASVSHDIRTPLTTIRALAHDIAADGDERALVIEEEGLRLNRFVADLLDLSRLSAGGLPLAIELNVAEDLIGAALQRVSGLALDREIRASLDPAEPVLTGRFDFAQSLRVLVNLLENALKYAPADTPIDLTVHREGPELAFAVADRGPGVPPDERTRIFEPFYRPPDARPDVGGAGLGLAIAHGLAAAQGGSVTYQPRDGGGSVFVLRLPAADLAEARWTEPS